MLIDTKQIITMTDLRKNLSNIVMLVKKGQEMLLSERGKFVVKLTPFKKMKTTNKKKEFDVIAETRALRKELSKKNPNFDSVKALREVRAES